MVAKDLLGLFLRNAERERRLKEAFAARGAELVSVYRRGPYAIEALYKTAPTHYWTIKARVDKTIAWTQNEIDVAVHYELIRELEEHLHGSEEIDAHASWGRSG